MFDMNPPSPETETETKVLPFDFETLVIDACKAMIRQGEPGIEPGADNGCRYRAEASGNGCLIGQMIPRHLYSRDMEGRNPAAVLGQVYGFDEISAVPEALWTSLQAAHDTVAGNWSPEDVDEVDDWDGRLDSDGFVRGMLSKVRDALNSYYYSDIAAKVATLVDA
jgi:hypothetical protein